MICSKAFSTLIPCLFAGFLTVAHGGEFGNRHVILFGIDGCRSDALKLAVEAGKAPNISALIQSGTVTWNAYAGGELDKPTQQATYSGPGWSSIFTAVWHDKHGVTDNSFRGDNFNRYPNFMDRLHAVHPAADQVSLISWPPLHESLIKPVNGDMNCTCHTYNHADPIPTEKKLIDQTVWLISSGDPDVVFCYQGNIDHVGHTWGFSPQVPEYMEAIRLTDERIGEVIAAVGRRPKFTEENWLFVVATDHGGIEKRHGGQSPEERTIPLIVAGGDIPKGMVSDAVIGQVAVPATVFRHLQVEVPASWGWVGTAFPETDSQP
jgi:predicted AlkP superfamily pyrophosphatase or phosphodiesterase